MVVFQEHKIRETMVGEMRKEFGELNLTFSIGGQISFDLFPTVKTTHTYRRMRDMYLDVEVSVFLAKLRFPYLASSLSLLCKLDG